MWKHIALSAHLIASSVAASIGSDSAQQVLGSTSQQGDYRVVKTASSVAAGYQLRVKSTARGGLCDPDVHQVSGYLDVARGDHIFFWFFESRNDPDNAPLVSWFNGGPGASSATGLLMELGPCNIQQNGTGTKINPFSWNTNANIMFIDQPLTVGYSYTERNTVVSTSARAAVDIYNFLQLFYLAFPKYAEAPYYLTGESYAGHYLPAFATEIVARNAEGAGIHIPLDSLVLGNAWVDPYTQVAEAPEYVCTGPYSHLIVDDPNGKECQRMRSQVKSCQRLIAACNARPSRWTCVPAEIACEFVPWKESPVDKRGLNPFDVRRPCLKTASGDCYEESDWISTYLNRPDVKEAIGIPENVKFNSGSNTVGLAFAASGDVFFSMAPLIAPLLDAGVRILNYAGKADSRCDYFGDLAWMSKIDHAFAREIGTVFASPWESDGEIAGEIIAAGDGNYTFLAVNGAGHLLPFDQGKVALDMFDRWVAREI